jgi:erythromycin esterase-like protein
MSDKPMFYPMAAELAEYVLDVDAEFAKLLREAFDALAALGAESNDALSAVSTWTALLVKAGTSLIAARVEERGLPPLPPDKAAQIFLEDVLLRASLR